MVAKDTKQQVDKVRALYKRHVHIVEHLLNGIDAIVEEFIQLIKQQQENNDCDNDCNKVEDALSEIITMNQGLLYALHVSHPKLNKIVNLAQEIDNACKITGSGGGGCCYILVRRRDLHRVDKIIESLTKGESTFVTYKAQLGSQGVRFEHKQDRKNSLFI